MYGKKDDLEVYIHAHYAGSSEIGLNLAFRDALRGSDALRGEYRDLKRTILAGDDTHSTLGSTGITHYNLQKNDFIVRVLRAAGFDGFCPRFCTQDTEWEVYNLLRKTTLTTKGLPVADVDTTDMSSRYFVFYKGTDIKGASRVQFSGGSASLEFVGMTGVLRSQVEEFLMEMVTSMERWLLTQGVRVLSTQVLSSDATSYESLGFNRVHAAGSLTDLVKVIVS